MQTIDQLLKPFDERYTVDQILTGANRGKFATKFNDITIKHSDTMTEAIDYSYQYQGLRMSEFVIDCPNLLQHAPLEVSSEMEQ